MLFQTFKALSFFGVFIFLLHLLRFFVSAVMRQTYRCQCEWLVIRASSFCAKSDSVWYLSRHNGRVHVQIPFESLQAPTKTSVSATVHVAASFATKYVCIPWCPT